MRKLIPLIGLFVAAYTYPLCAGWNANGLRNLDVSVQYMGNPSSEGGMPVFYVGDPVRYRVTIRNMSNRPFKRLGVQASAHWARSISCRSPQDGRIVTYQMGADMPGMSRTPERILVIPPHGMASFDVRYDVPLSACPGEGEIYIDGGPGGKSKPPLRLPQHFLLRVR